MTAWCSRRNYWNCSSYQTIIYCNDSQSQVTAAAPPALSLLGSYSKIYLMFLENMSIDVTRFGEPSFLLFHYHSDVLHSFSVHALIFITLYEKVWFKKLVPTIYTTVCFSFFMSGA